MCSKHAHEHNGALFDMFAAYKIIVCMYVCMHVCMLVPAWVRGLRSCASRRAVIYFMQDPTAVLRIQACYWSVIS